MTEEEFYQELAKFNINLSDQQKKQFETYFKTLVEWNQKMNLTAITEKQDVYLKHFYDSLAPILYKIIPNQELNLLDIGAGAGFPSIPMKIIFPEIKITIIDSLNKRITFLDNLSQELGLKNITLLHGRAEDFGQDKNFRNQFDFVTARAVARLNVLSELTIPFLKKGGQLISLKASQMADEVIESKNAFNILGGKLQEQVDYNLPNGDERHLVLVKKTKDTPKKYPRKAGTPNKTPL